MGRDPTETEIRVLDTYWSDHCHLRFKESLKNYKAMHTDIYAKRKDKPLPEGKEETEQWLLQFKNETHNHPTEIEPFGGAATCIGGIWG